MRAHTCETGHRAAEKVQATEIIHSTHTHTPHSHPVRTRHTLHAMSGKQKKGRKATETRRQKEEKGDETGGRPGCQAAGAPWAEV